MSHKRSCMVVNRHSFFQVHLIWWSYLLFENSNNCESHIILQNDMIRVNSHIWPVNGHSSCFTWMNINSTFLRLLTCFFMQYYIIFGPLKILADLRTIHCLLYIVYFVWILRRLLMLGREAIHTLLPLLKMKESPTGVSVSVTPMVILFILVYDMMHIYVGHKLIMLFIWVNYDDQVIFYIIYFFFPLSYLNFDAIYIINETKQFVSKFHGRPPSG